MLSILRKYVVNCLLFVAGLAVGAIFFLPWDTVWAVVLEKAAARSKAVQVSWDSLSDGTVNSYTLSGVRIQAGKSELFIPRLSASLGLSPLLSLVVDTRGSLMDVGLSRSGDVVFDGDLDLGVLLPKTKIEGLAQGRGAVKMNLDAGLPEYGQVEIAMPVFIAPDGMRVTNVAVKAALQGDTLTVEQFSADKPIPVQATGTANLNWKQMAATTFEFSGTVMLGDTEQTFVKKGTVAEVQRRGLNAFMPR